MDFHIDVVPGRFTDETKTDAYLYQSGGDKKRLKTNLDVHLDHVRDSDVIDAIRLAKLWKVRNALPIRTFVLELAVIKLLEKKKNKSLSAQMEHFWTELRDNSANLTVEDPANPNGNDLSKCLDDNLKSQLAAAAKRTLEQIDSSGWEAVYRENGRAGKGGARRDFATCRGRRNAVTALASGRMTWHRNDPALYEKEKAEVEAYFPDLHFVVENDIVYVRGSFPLMFEGRCSIATRLNYSLPGTIPRDCQLFVKPAAAFRVILIDTSLPEMAPPACSFRTNAGDSGRSVAPC